MINVKVLAEFEENGFGLCDIREWALTDGGLSRLSASAFAVWLDTAWNDFDDGSGTRTNEDVLKSALWEWRGGS